MNFTFIDITEIFRRQNKVLKSETSNWLVFYLIPLALGCSFVLCGFKGNHEHSDFISVNIYPYFH